MSEGPEKRLVAVNFLGLLPCDLATQVHVLLKNAKYNAIGDVEYSLDVWERKKDEVKRE